MTLPAGDYIVTASAAGYNSQSKQISLAPGEVRRLDFELAPESSTPSLPQHTVYGFVFTHDLENATNVSVTLTHESGTLHTTTAADGSYVFNLANLPFYNDSDPIRVTATLGESMAELNATINMSEEPQRLPDLILNAAPSVILESPENAALLNTSVVVFEWRGGDPDGDPLNFTLYIDVKSTFDSPALKIIDASGTSRKYVQLADGTWYWQVLASDSFVLTASEVRSFTIDTVPPQVTIDAINVETLENPYVVTGTFVESGSGISSITVNGVDAEISGSRYRAEVQLHEGVNVILVKAIDNAGNVGTNSTHVTLLSTASLMLYSGWNLIGLPLDMSTDAEGFCDAADIAVITRWDPTTKSFVSHVRDTAANNFMLSPEEGYWVYSERRHDTQITGVRPNSTTYVLRAGWNLIGGISGSAEEICNLLGCYSVTKWDAVNQRYVSHIAGMLSNNFEVARQDGLWVWMDHDAIVVVTSEND